MLHSRFAMVRSVLILTMILASLAAVTPLGASASQSGAGLVDANSYESPQFGYAITWAEPWAARERDAISNPGGFDTLTLRGNGTTLRMSGRSDDYSALTFLQDSVAIQLASGGEVIDQDTTGEAPMTELSVGRDRMRIVVIPVPTANAIVLVNLRAPAGQFDDALASAQQSVQLNESPIFDGGAQPVPTETSATEIVPTDAPPTQPAPTEPGATDTPSVEPTPTISAPTQAVEPTSEPLLPTQPVDSTATPASSESNVDGNTYTSDMFGYSISWDEAVWDVPDDAEFAEEDYQSLYIESDTGPLWTTGWIAYNGSASTCLLGEIEYYNDPELGITEWEVAVDGEGNELTGSSETSAWGVFTNVYVDPEDPAAEPREFVDYLECQSLGDGESVVIFHAYSERESYNEHIESVLAVVDSLKLSDHPAAATPAIENETPTPAVPDATPAGTVADLTAVSGQTYPYVFGVPADWQIESAELGSGIETTTVSNGVSTISIEARAMSVPSLAQCVKDIADEDETEPAYSDLALSRTASGDAFSGEDDFIAFANFTFTGPDGETWAHFVECRSIVEGESVLVVTQDVPQELFGSERSGRRQIQNTIRIGQ